ncbi:intracellular coagulation inhibitor 2-like [Argiope bruennichi]|uniref:intracellular coagulation inhibitor 2-like n=1 Tax=Argiope bruennichi TaxID=94029 RepID=UPI002494B712|nr:intracellular coagulation inhibitor 2-like [Argiope bruennichi]XP_055950654.1 intracellular coagulation inhibitor 2-like [Argiope bruennichi]
MACVSVFSVLLAFCVALASAGTSCTQQEMAKENLQKLALANNELAFNLHRKLASGSSENVFFSPFSISTAFAMLFYGASGDTAQELRETLGYEKADILSDVVHDSFNRFLTEVLSSGDSSDGYVLNAANAVLFDKRLELLEEYKSDVEELYKAAVRDVDFMTEAPKVVKDINAWVREKTNGKIEKLFDELSPSTVLVLLNAVYFKGTWKTQFEKSHTRDQLFYNNGLQSAGKKVPLMHLTAQFPYTSVDNFQVLELPYKGENVSMLILLPNQRDGLQALEQNLTPEKLADVQQKLYKTKVEVSLPKFKLQFEKELSPEMKALGANQIFNAGSADFSGMTSCKNVFVSQILHKAVIEVNEEGSEAAAVTGIVANRMRPIVDMTPVFKADHPFLFAIVEKSSNMILFLGRVSNL